MRIVGKVMVGLLLIAVLSVFVAAQKGPKELAGKPLDAGNATTYGTCVSEGAIVKNTCYSTVKTERATCRSTAQNQTDKAGLRECNADYKKDKKQCKMDFKSAKKTCAQQYKPRFFEKMRAAFK